MASTTTLYTLVEKGGPVMIPIIMLSVGTLACALDRGWFWYRLRSQEQRVVHDVLTSARVDLDKAEALAEQSQDLPIGRFLLAPLQLRRPSPETFRLAMETAADEEFGQMSRGNTILEAAVTIAPLLGLLGTVTGLIVTFENLNIGGAGGKSNVDLSKAASGISEALITTAGGMIVAIIAASLLRLFTRLQRQQMDYFAKVGGRLELIYRQFWYEPNALGEYHLSEDDEDTLYNEPQPTADQGNLSV
jgi:biopolymer transport protein ExbB